MVQSSHMPERKTYGEKAIDFSLLSFAGLVIAQLISESEIEGWVMMVGFGLFVGGIVVGRAFLKSLTGGEEG